VELTVADDCFITGQFMEPEAQPLINTCLSWSENGLYIG